LVVWKAYQDELPYLDEIRSYWKEYPAANIAVVTGRIKGAPGKTNGLETGISVVDIDGEAGLNSVKEHGLLLPKTYTVKTPNGYHLYYRYTTSLQQGGNFYPGIDVRNDGGYVIAPPSRVNGKTYTVMRWAPCAEALGVTIKRQQATRPPQEQQDRHDPHWVTDALAGGVPEHERNDTATRLVGYFHGKGLSASVIDFLLEQFAGRCNPPMDIQELRRTIESVRRYPGGPFSGLDGTYTGEV
jgi:hypothetical protein